MATLSDEIRFRFAELCVAEPDKKRKIFQFSSQARSQLS